MPGAPEVFTIGHSTHEIDRFIDLLRLHGITAVADVRSVPYSRVQPQFNREALRKALKQHGIAYVFLGKELGARSEDPRCYVNGKVQYRRLARTSLFREGINRVRNGSASHRIALMCAERDPLDCHRTVLVSRELVADGVEVVHIHADGRAEPHEVVLNRLVERLGLADGDLFETPVDLFDEAYALQEERIAYVGTEPVRGQRGTRKRDQDEASNDRIHQENRRELLREAAGVRRQTGG